MLESRKASTSRLAISSMATRNRNPCAIGNYGAWTIQRTLTLATLHATESVVHAAQDCVDPQLGFHNSNQDIMKTWTHEGMPNPDVHNQSGPHGDWEFDHARSLRLRLAFSSWIDVPMKGQQVADTFDPDFSGLYQQPAS